MSIGAYLGRFGKENPELADDEDYQSWARKVKKAVIAAVQKQTGIKPVWSEGKDTEEEIGMEIGGWDGIVQLQRYAAHLNFTGSPPRGPATDEELDNDDFLLRYREAMDDESGIVGSDFKFRHLVMTSDGIRYIPLDFPEPLLVEEEGNDGTFSIGSSQGLYDELDEINSLLQVDKDFGQMERDEGLDLDKNAKDLWGSAKWAWMVLHWLARESVDRKLCIYLD